MLERCVSEVKRSRRIPRYAWKRVLERYITSGKAWSKSNKLVQGRRDGGFVGGLYPDIR